MYVDAFRGIMIIFSCWNSTKHKMCSWKYQLHVCMTFVGGLLAFGSQSLVESVNNFLVLVVLTSFGGLVSLQIPGLQIAQLFHPQDYSAVLPAVPVMFVALVYHNIVPTICSALKYDRKKITIALTAGTFIPLVMFIVWIGVSLGSSSMCVCIYVCMHACLYLSMFVYNICIFIYACAC